MNTAVRGALHLRRGGVGAGGRHQPDGALQIGGLSSALSMSVYKAYEPLLAPTLSLP